MPQNNPCVTNGLLPPDIYTQNLATQLTYNIDFDFVAEEDVVVFREQPAGTFTLLTNSAATGATPPNYTINQGVSPAQVTFNVGEAPGGVSLIIGRRTDICDPVVTYQVGAAIRAGDLNASNIQLLHLIQELRSVLGFMINGNSTDPIVPGQGMDLNDLDDVNVGDPVNPDPALLRYNGTEWVGNTVLQDNDAWVSNDTTFATTAAGDDRWLQLPGPGGNFTAGAGIEFDTTTPNQVTIAADLAANGGLEFSAAGNAGEIQINTNLGCETVAAGLNTQTTSASIVQTGGDNEDPAIRITETLGGTDTNTDLQITGGANTTVTRNSNNELTIESSGGVGTTYRGTVDVTDDATLPANALVNDLFANDTQGTQTANWQTVITGASTTANAGDLLLCTTAAGGVATDARYTLIESGTDVPAATTPNLQDVTDEGNTTTNGADFGGLVAVSRTTDTNAAFQATDGNAAQPKFRVTAGGRLTIGTNVANGPDINIQLDQNGRASFAGGDIQLQADGSAHFNAGNNNADFRVDGDTSDNVLFVDASTNSVGIGTDTPAVIAGMSRYLTLSETDANSAVGLELQGNRTGNDQVVGRISFINDTTENARITVDSGTGAGTNSNMIFATGGTTEQMRITSAGRVGIGTVSPNALLNVDGQVSITQTAIAAGAGNWNLANGNFWTLGAVTVPDPTNMVPGMSGLIVNTAAATWPAAGGATFQYAGGAVPNITQFPAVIPFYCTNNTTIFIGTPTVNIT